MKKSLVQLALINPFPHGTFGTWRGYIGFLNQLLININKLFFFRSSSHHDIIEDNDYEVPFGHLIPKPRSQIADRGSSLSSMNLQSHHSDHRDHRDHRDHQQHFNSFIHHQYMQPQLQRSSSMRPQFYHHDVDT